MKLKLLDDRVFLRRNIRCLKTKTDELEISRETKENEACNSIKRKMQRNQRSWGIKSAAGTKHAKVKLRGALGVGN